MDKMMVMVVMRIMFVVLMVVEILYQVTVMAMAMV